VIEHLITKSFNYFCNFSSSFEIYQIKRGNKTILSLDDYVKANKNDGTDQADSFVFRIYDKDSGELIREITTDQLQAAGAFESSSGEKIFEDPDSGMLA
jgi:hypothetical protein